MHTLTSRGSFWVAAAVASVALWTSAAPSVTYPLYASEWHLTPIVTVSIFATYPAVLVAVLTVSGDLSDHIGSRATILLGLLASLLGSLLFALASSVAWVFAGRSLMGIGVGLALSPATAAMVEFSPVARARRASAITTAATAVGLVLATLIGGGLIQYAPFPTHLDFWVLSAVITSVLGFAWFLPRSALQGTTRPWRPKLPTIPREMRPLFATSAMAVVAAYAAGGVVLALGAEIAGDLIRSHNALVNGAAISLISATIAGVALLVQGRSGRRLIVFGGISTTLGMTLLVLSADQRALSLFLASAVVIGAGYSLLFVGGLTLINTEAPTPLRLNTLSAAYLLAYLGQVATVVALGLLATASGLSVALNLGAPIVVTLALTAVVLAGPGVTRTTKRSPSSRRSVAASTL